MGCDALALGCLLLTGWLGLAHAEGGWPGGPLVVAVPDRSEAPFVTYTPDGRAEGYDPAVAATLAAALGADLELVPTPGGRAGVLGAVAEGRARLGLARLAIDLQAARQVALSCPYAEPPRALLYNRRALARRAPGQSPAVLIGPSRDVAVVSGDGADHHLSAVAPGARTRSYADLEAAAGAVAGGDPAVLLSDRPRLRRWLAAHPTQGLAVGYWELGESRDPVVAAVPWQDAWLVGWLDTTLEILESDGTLPALRARYLEPAEGSFR